MSLPQWNWELKTLPPQMKTLTLTPQPEPSTQQRKCICALFRPGTPANNMPCRCSRDSSLFNDDINLDRKMIGTSREKWTKPQRATVPINRNIDQWALPTPISCRQTNFAIVPIQHCDDHTCGCGIRASMQDITDENEP